MFDITNSKLSPKEKAESIIENTWKTLEIPVCPLKIAARLGLPVLADPNLNVLGSIKFDEGMNSYLISYNSSESETRQRFTVSHELGHYILGHGTCYDTEEQFRVHNKNVNEVDSNIFAVCLLIPEKSINAMIRIRNICSINDLSKMFKVSMSAMKWRLKMLGYTVN